MKAIAVACLLTLLSLPAGAVTWWSFENHPYYDPLIAGVRDPNVSALFPARFDRMAQMVGTAKKRNGWDIDLGAELPIFGSSSSAEPGKIIEGQWGWGLWIPIDFHMIEAFGSNSAPIINTDYRFSGVLKFRRGLPNHRAAALRLQFGHESTHLGDEFSIDAQAASPATFERINVSWQYLDLGALYEWPQGDTQWNARAGVTMTVPFASSYYQSGPGTVTVSPFPVTDSKNWIDPYAGLELNRDGVIFHETWGVYASTELRWRSVYNYHKANPNQSEDRQASINIIAGIKKNGSGRGVGRASPFFRFYHGVNPHGQFRNQKSYTEMGIGLRLVR